jgi:hypothetical protein
MPEAFVKVNNSSAVPSGNVPKEVRDIVVFASADGAEEVDGVDSGAGLLQPKVPKQSSAVAAAVPNA